MVAEKRQFKMPHTLVILFALLIVAWLAGRFIPSGAYEMAKDPVSGKNLVVPGTFHYVEKTTISFFALMDYVVQGFIKSADLFFLILFSGAAFHLVTLSGALHSLVGKVMQVGKKKNWVFIVTMTAIFAALGTTHGVNLFIPFVPVTLTFAYALGFDSLVGVGVILIGGAVGFSTGTFQVNTTLVAQEIAGLAPYSGIGYRALCLLIFYLVSVAWLIRYSHKIAQDPSVSAMYDLDQVNELRTQAQVQSFEPLTLRGLLSLAALVVALALFVYGGTKLKWKLNNFSAVFLWLCVVVGLINRYRPSKLVKEMLQGAKTMFGAAVIIGLARSISMILSDSGVIDTVVHGLSLVLGYAPGFMRAPVMFIINIFVNMLITSGSGQAAVVMPLFLPVADLIGMTRQTAILAYNFGDGFCNYILPTSTALMGLLGAANVPYDRWMRFFWKLFCLWVGVGVVLVWLADVVRLA